jgi:hypothetical protein
VTAGTQQAARRGDRLLGPRGVVEHARHHDEIRAAALADVLGEPGVLDLALAEPHVRQAPPGELGAAPGEPRRAAIDRDHAVVERRQHREQRALAGADVDRERATGQQRRDDRQPREQLAGIGRERHADVVRRVIEEPARQLLALRDDAGDPREAAILAAQPAAFLERGIDHHGIAPRQIDMRAQQRPRAIATRRQQPDLAQRLRLLGDLGLALGEQRCELAHGQLVLRAQRQQAQAVLVSEETKQVGTGSKHHDVLYIPSCAWKQYAKYTWQDAVMPRAVRSWRLTCPTTAPYHDERRRDDHGFGRQVPDW